MSSEPLNAPSIGLPVGLLAELTHRCPLACPYCSNPLALEGREVELSTEDWKRVFSESAKLGILQVHLSGGEPAARRDLVELVQHCASVGLYTNLITSGIGVTEKLITELAEAGLDHIQLSIQDSDAESADKIAGYKGAFAKKQIVAGWIKAAEFPLTVNAVMHRANIARSAEMVELAIELGASRVEIAHTQYYGWALPNRAALMPSRTETETAVAEIEALRKRHHGEIVIDLVIPDYHATYPKACMGGWAKQFINVTPSGKVLPCHASETIPSLEFWNVKERSLSDIWYASPAFNAYRGTDWMAEPCRSCDRRDIDYGGCRCQAFAILGDASATDPACHRSPHHKSMTEIAESDSVGAVGDYIYRKLPVNAA
jgi:pyrroloquinoline quinone biosynthesis protein E